MSGRGDGSGYGAAENDLGQGIHGPMLTALPGDSRARTVAGVAGLRQPPRAGLRDANLSATVAMVVMRPAAGVMEVAPLPALNREFTRYSLA